jgi:hypothetical protein
MSPGLFCLARMPKPRKHSAPLAPGSQGRKVAWRGLNVLALLLLALLPLQGSIQSATAAANAKTVRVMLDPSSARSGAARVPKVFIKLDKHRITTKQRAQVKVALSVRGTRSAGAGARQSRSLGSGQVKVVAKSGGKGRPVRARLSAGKAVVTLPKLPRGVYQVRATFLGNALLSKARSEYRTLRVVRPGGGDAASCGSTAANVPDGSDGRGGCFPGLSNTGPKAPASSMATYRGSCAITAANTVIDSKVVNCRTIDVRAGGFVLKNSYLNGAIVQSRGAAAYTVQDSFIDSGVQFPACSNGSCPAGKYACGDTNNQTTDCGVNGSNFTVLRTEIINTNRAAYCQSNCLIRDSYFHGTNLWPDASNLAHASSVREEQNLTLRHNSLHCSYTGPFVNGEIGCSADLTGYADFAPIRNNTVDGNLFVANPGNAFCAYGGATSGKPFSGDPTNGTNQKFTNNVFQRGGNRKCSAYGPVADFDKKGTGNVWSGNVWDDGAAVKGVM